jgi:hypothetical protein
VKWRKLYKESENDFYATHSNREILEILREDIVSCLPLRYKGEIMGNEIAISYDDKGDFSITSQHRDWVNN